MAARYTGRKPIKTKDGRIYKTNDIIDSITDEQAKVLKQFEPVMSSKKEYPKKKEKSDE